MSASRERCVLSDRDVSDWPIPRLEESYRLRCAIVIYRPQESGGYGPG
jgi:hypothetical protein